jgi:ribosomal protein L40E
MAKHLTTCPACGAANSADSEWCGQCYTSLVRPEERPAPSTPSVAVADDGPAGPDDVGITTSSGAATGTGPDTEGADRRWTCSFCGNQNPVEASNCLQCYRSIYDSFGAGAEEKTIDPGEALRHAAFFPGLGLIRAGWSAHGIAIAAVSLFAIASALFLIPTGEVVPGLVLLMLGGVVWAIAARDAGEVADGRPGNVWLTPQVLLVAAVLVFVIAGLAFAQALGEARSRV